MSTCSICFDSLICKDAGQACCIPCGHLFHVHCLSDWFKTLHSRDKKCPQCRSPSSERQVIKLYFNDEKDSSKNKSAKFWRRQVEQLADSLENTEEQLQVAMQNNSQLSQQVANRVKEKDKQLTDSNKKLVGSIEQVADQVWDLDDIIRDLVEKNVLLSNQVGELVASQGQFAINEHARNVSYLKDLVQKLIQESRSFQQSKKSVEVFLKSVDNRLQDTLSRNRTLIQDCTRQSELHEDRLRAIETCLDGELYPGKGAFFEKQMRTYSKLKIFGTFVGLGLLWYYLRPKITEPSYVADKVLQKSTLFQFLLL